APAGLDDRAVHARQSAAQRGGQFGEQLAHGYSAMVTPTTTRLKPRLAFSPIALTGIWKFKVQCSLGLASTTGVSVGFLFGNRSMIPGCFRPTDFALNSCISFGSTTSGFLSLSAGDRSRKSLNGDVPWWSPSIG